MTLPPSLVKKLDRFAKVQEISRSAAARDLLSAALREGEDMVKVMANEKVRTALMRALMEPGVFAAMAQALGHELSKSERQQVLQFFESAGLITGKGNV